jgi:hypothetical protein
MIGRAPIPWANNNINFKHGMVEGVLGNVKRYITSNKTFGHKLVASSSFSLMNDRIEGCPRLFEVIRWIIDNIDVESRIVVNDQGGCIPSFLPSELEKYYKFYNPVVYMTTCQVEDFHGD